MTTPDHDPSDLRDPALEAAWRSASREVPPPALDAAILAAAHRAAGAGPQRAAARAPWRWWAPLAAAATIGAFAIGVLQLAPEEHGATPATVSDAPRVAARVQESAATPAQPAPPAAPAASAPPAAPAADAKRANEVAVPAASLDSAASEKKDRVSQSAAPAAGGALADDARATSKIERESRSDQDELRKQKSLETKAAPDPFPASKNVAVAAAPPPPASAPVNVPSATERQNADSGKNTVEQAPAGRAGGESARRAEASQDLPKDAMAAKPAVAASSAPPAVSPPSVATPVPASAAAAPAVAAPAPPPSMPSRTASAGFARDATPQQQLQADRQAVPAARSDNLAAMPQASGGRLRTKEEVDSKLAQSAPAAEPALMAKAQTDKARSPDDFIAAIRRRFAAGDTEAARRELIEFRRAFADADARLPVDLRAWAASVAR